MKKCLLVFILFVGGVSLSSAFGGQNIPMHIIKDDPMSDGKTYMPPRPWYITQDEHELTLPAFEDDYLLELRDSDNSVVFVYYVYAGTTTVDLPSMLSGEFELRLVPFSATYYYRGRLELY